jgi:N-acetylmuramoyl-L-alanine amidase
MLGLFRKKRGGDKMKKLVFLTILVSTLPLLFFSNSNTYAQTLEHIQIYEAKPGDTLYNISRKFGVPEIELKKINDQHSVSSGEKLILPEVVSEEEKALLARLVTAEAKGEPYEGKVAVATVVLNRVDHEMYPDSIKEVIYEKRQFQPVDNGMINKPATEEAEQAVNEAIAKQGTGKGSLNFYNPKIVDSEWHESKTLTAEIGNHVFTK